MKEYTIDEITEIKKKANATREEIYHIMGWVEERHILSDGDVRIVLETAQSIKHIEQTG